MEGKSGRGFVLAASGFFPIVRRTTMAAVSDELVRKKAHPVGIVCFFSIVSSDLVILFIHTAVSPEWSPTAQAAWRSAYA